MFANIGASVRFVPERPISQNIAGNSDCQVIVFGLEPHHEVTPHTSSSTVVMYVVEGSGHIRVGEQERPVSSGDVAFCPPQVVHAFTAGPNRLVIMAVVAPRP